MPLNKYKCSCGKDYEFIGPHMDRECPSCSKQNKPLLPKVINGPSVMETVDKDRNVKWRDNFEERAKKRSNDYLKHEAKERARENGDAYEKHGLTEDDPKLT